MNMEVVDQSREILNRLQPGDAIEVVHEVKVGMQRWTTTTRGNVVRIERRRHGLHFKRNPDDKVYSDMIILDRGDGELTTLTIDEFTVIKKR
jgi:hypothetical protein